MTFTDWRVTLELTTFSPAAEERTWVTAFVVAAENETNAVGNAMLRAVNESVDLSSVRVVMVSPR